MNKRNIPNYTWAKPLLAVLVASAFTVACGGGGSGGRDPILGSGSVNAVFVVPGGAVSPGGPGTPGIPGTPGTTCPVASATTPVVLATSPTNGNQFATTSTAGTAGGGKQIDATFSLPMDQATINTSTFSIAPFGGAALVPASVTYNTATMVASLSTSSSLQPNLSYTAVIQSGAKSAAGTAVGCPYVWTFKTAAVAAAGLVTPSLGSAVRFGTFGGTAGMTNTGIQTIITGSNGNTADIGTIATGTSAITGFHDSAPSDVYTETGANVGNVTGKIYTCTTSTTGPTSAAVSAPSCAIAKQARLDAQTAYLALVALPPGANPGGNLAGLTLAPGVYTAPAGSFMIQGGDLTLDAQGNPDAAWVFQMASTLTVGGPGAAFPQRVVLAGGAQAKNVSWQVGSNAVINAAGGGAMVGNIISQQGTTFSTVGNTLLTALNGRVLSLIASVTLVNTAITVPAP